MNNGIIIQRNLGILLLIFLFQNTLSFPNDKVNFANVKAPPPPYCNMPGASSLPECKKPTTTNPPPPSQTPSPTTRSTVKTTKASTTTTLSPECPTRNAERVVEGDMVYYIERDNTTRAGAITENGRTAFLRWPGNTVIYQVSSELLDKPDHLRKIYAAMNDIADAVPDCVTFRPRNNRDSHWATLQSDLDGCFSKIGYNPRLRRNQNINFNENCPPGSMVHELLHTLGFLHEHARNDRDDYVYVDFDNIKEDKYNNFIKDEERYTTSYYNVNYNYESIMHYPLYGSFAIDENKPYMIHLNNSNGLGYRRDISRRANRNFLSRGDLLMVARRHECSEPSWQTYPVSGARESDTSEYESAPPIERDEC